MKCPSCDSENTIKSQVAYQSGTSTGSFGGIGVDLQGDVGGFGGVSSSQTLFAQSVSPPTARGNNPRGLIGLIVGGILTIFSLGFYHNASGSSIKAVCVLLICAGILCLIGSLYFCFTDHALVMKAHKRDLEKWARQWVCLRCGTKFEPSTK